MTSTVLLVVLGNSLACGVCGCGPGAMSPTGLGGFSNGVYASYSWMRFGLETPSFLGGQAYGYTYGIGQARVGGRYLVLDRLALELALSQISILEKEDGQPASWNNNVFLPELGLAYALIKPSDSLGLVTDHTLVINVSHQTSALVDRAREQLLLAAFTAESFTTGLQYELQRGRLGFSSQASYTHQWTAEGNQQFLATETSIRWQVDLGSSSLSLGPLASVSHFQNSREERFTILSGGMRVFTELRSLQVKLDALAPISNRENQVGSIQVFEQISLGLAKNF